ncbi:MAG TPA: hypothetical protein VFL73_02070 [Solirubrobacteraceae bacterium]|jgi:hypothetical protein|nr:hypothetical protein [Solirubrobacteraceae bacterium]
MKRALVLALPLLATAGCGGSGQDQTGKVSAAAQSYVAAFSAHDAGATCRAMTEHSQELVAEFAREHMHLRGATCAKAVALLPAAPRSAKVGDVRVTGSRATVAVDGFDRPLSLVQEHGAWRVQSAPSGETD